MRNARGVYAVLLVGLTATLALLAGCSHGAEGRSISPAPEAQGRANVGLGPGVRPLSSGPGEKGSPSWGPEGARIAFIVDGYVVDKPLGAPDVRRRTTRDFGARAVSWMSSGEGMVILAAEPSGARSSPDRLTAYQTVPREGSLEVTRLATGVLSMASDPGGEVVLLALEDGDGSRLALVGSSDEPLPYPGRIEGDVTGFSLSPTRDQAVLAVRSPGPQERFELRALSLAGGGSQLLAQLEPGLEVFGAPQWTPDGVYYVAGRPAGTGEQSAAPYGLYRLPPGSEAPEPAPGIGNDFVALSLSRHPDGGRLAVIGRRSPGSTLNLYEFDPATENLLALTTNENMEIKTGSGDLAWSADGRSILIVARSVLSEPQTYATPADAVVNGFYNLYEVPVEKIARGRAS